MSKFNGLELSKILEILDENEKDINDFDFGSLSERDLICQVIKERPGYFLLIKKENLFEELVKTFLFEKPAMYESVPKELRTQYVKMALIEREPSIVEIFDFNDFDDEIIKYLYINYPELLEDFEDKKIANKIKKVVKNLKKQGIKPIIDSEKEEE